MSWHYYGVIFAVWWLLLILFAGCSLTVGGAKFCFLDHADLTVTTHHAHADPNAQ